jgi:hypothetical protein
MSAEPKAISPPEPSNWQKRIVYFLPLILPLVVVVTFLAFYKQFLLCSAAHPCSPFTSAEFLAGVSNTDQTRVAAYVARASWTLISGVHLIACLLAIVTAGYVIYNALSQYDASIRWMIILITVAAALNISLGVSLWSLKDVLSPAQQLHQATIGQVLPSISKYNRLAEVFSLTGALSLAVAACAVLWQSDVNKNLDEETLKKRIGLLKPVLYVAAAVLVMSVLRLSATHAWAVSYLSPETEVGKTVASLTTGIVGSLGATYTLVIAGIYLPAAFMLRSRLREVAPTQSITDGWTQLLLRVMALIGPLLAGPLGDLLVKVTNSFGGSV